MIVFACPNPACRKRYKVPDDKAGKTTTCANPACGMRIQVPNPLTKPDPVPGDLIDEETGAVLRDWHDEEAEEKPIPRDLVPEPEDDDDSYDYVPMRRRSRKHSGLGIGSFIIAVVVGGLDAVLGLIAVLNVAGSKGEAEVRDRFLGGAMAMVCLNCLSIPLCLVGVGLALAALIAHPNRKHSMTYVGLVVNALVVLSILGLYTFGSMSRR